MFECAENIKTAQFNMQYLSIIAIFVMQFAVFCVFLHTKYINIKNGELNCNIPRTRH
jgi:hypothetical protein